ncbi:hypothetical protein [Xenorhabdus sp. SGI246]|uniref:DUF7823 domain-containing protein n=1 Tax=Xenorhabdus sp. SGI246 TaxID=3158263 RepID=UPI00349FC561
MACDWNLLKSESKPEPKPVDCMLEFDLKVGVPNTEFGYGPMGMLWGFTQSWWSPYHSTSGDLNMGPNKLDIVGIYGFFWLEYVVYIGITAKQDKGSHQKVVDLFQNNVLWVTVDGVRYNLGKSPPVASPELFPAPSGPYDYVFSYRNSDAQKLGETIKQNGDKTIHVCLNWK